MTNNKILLSTHDGDVGHTTLYDKDDNNKIDKEIIETKKEEIKVSLSKKALSLIQGNFSSSIDISNLSDRALCVIPVCGIFFPCSLAILIMFLWSSKAKYLVVGIGCPDRILLDSK